MTEPTYVLPAGARRVLLSLVPVVAPPEAVMRGLASAIVDAVERQLAAMPTLMRNGVLAGLVTYDLGAVVYPAARGRRAHRLQPTVAARYFASWVHGPTPLHRQFGKALGQLLAMATYEQPEMLASIGYTPTAWIDTVKARRLRTYGGEIDAFEAQRLAPDPLRPPRVRRGKAVAS